MKFRENETYSAVLSSLKKLCQKYYITWPQKSIVICYKSKLRYKVLWFWGLRYSLFTLTEWSCSLSSWEIEGFPVQALHCTIIFQVPKMTTEHNVLKKVWPIVKQPCFFVFCIFVIFGGMFDGIAAMYIFM